MNKMFEDLSPIYAAQGVPVEQINRIIGDLKAINEPILKKNLQEWIRIGAFDDNQAGKERMEKFIGSHYEYFSSNNFFDNELSDLNAVCNESWVAVQNFLFLKFKAILSGQLDL
jgi:hypothetical protein